MSVQVKPSPLKPGAQAQLKLPAVLLHVALALHGGVVAAHSLT